MRKDFVNEVARTQNVKRADLIEKDLILHQILIDLSKNKFFHDNFAFKGDTAWLNATSITSGSLKTSISLGKIRAHFTANLKKKSDGICQLSLMTLEKSLKI
jgi:hypothetical protein